MSDFEYSRGGVPFRHLKGTVLVVDDEQDVLDGLVRALRHGPFRVIGALGPRVALETLGRERVQIVVSDIKMPGMDGIEFLDIVRDRFPDVVRIILTGHPETGSAMAAINDEEVFRYLTKPITRDQLLVTLHLAFERFTEEQETRVLAAEGRAHREALLTPGGSLLTPGGTLMAPSPFGPATTPRPAFTPLGSPGTPPPAAPPSRPPPGAPEASPEGQGTGLARSAPLVDAEVIHPLSPLPKSWR